MIIGLLILGALLISTGMKGTGHELGQQLQADLLGVDGFVAWIAAIVALGCLGYVPGLQRASRYLLALLAVVVILRNGGLFANVQKSLEMASGVGPAPSVATAEPAASSGSGGSTTTTAATSSGTSGGGSSGGGSSGGIDIGTVATVAELALLL